MRALWTAATGMKAQQLNIDTIANNLSNCILRVRFVAVGATNFALLTMPALIFPSIKCLASETS